MIVSKNVRSRAIKISEYVEQRLLCPQTKNKLIRNGEYLENEVDRSIRYPIIEGIPILIDSEKSLFSVEDFIKGQDTTFNLKPEHPVKKIVKRMIPDISVNLKANKNYAYLASSLPAGAKILVIGGSIKGEGMEPIYDNESFEIVGSDVSFGEYTSLVSDAHDIPFDECTFDCVIVQAVLEHVLDPNRCVAEIHRVLKPSGIVYSETPFMQQVHMKQYDFTRFTHLGHRWLFKNFEEIESGPCCGPGMSLAWAYSGFLKSFASTKIPYLIASKLANITSFFFKYFDRLIIDRPAAYDAASGFYFIGRKSDRAITGKELIKGFRGMK